MAEEKLTPVYEALGTSRTALGARMTKFNVSLGRGMFSPLRRGAHAAHCRDSGTFVKNPWCPLPPAEQQGIRLAMETSAAVQQRGGALRGL